MPFCSICVPTLYSWVRSRKIKDRAVNYFNNLTMKMVEAAGIEPASEDLPHKHLQA